MLIAKDFYFEAGHSIPGHAKCGDKHGHSYRVRVMCEGEVQENGMVIDFGDIKNIVNEKVISKLDHKYLNDIIGLENPTSENLCVWISRELVTELVGLSTIRVWETKDSYVEIGGTGEL